MTSNAASSIPAWTKLIENGAFLALVLGAAGLTGAMGLRLFQQLPALPFRRFWSRREWFINSWYFPLLTLNTVWLLLLFVGLLGARGVLYFVLFVFVQLLAQRAMPAALGIGLITATVTYLGAVESGVIVTGSVCVLLGIISTWRTTTQTEGRATERPSVRWRLLTIDLRKELAYHRVFTSDTVHLVLAFAVWALSVRMLLDRPDKLTDSYGLVFICVLSTLPFSRVLFNLMGMDSNGLRRLVNDPTLLVPYLIIRTRRYGLLVYCSTLVFAVLQARVGNAVIIPRLLLTSLACTELVLFIGFYMSTYFYEEKEAAYRYGQNLQSRNIHISLFVLFAIGGAVHSLYLVGGLVALALVAVAALFLNSSWLKQAGIEVVESRRNKLMHAIR